MLSAVYQTGILVYLSAGSGYWLWRFTGRQKLLLHWWWLWCALGGFCLQALVLQECYYAGLNLRLAIGLAALASGAGCCGWLLAARNFTPRQKKFLARQAAILIAVGAGVWIAQGAGLLWRGPSHYFGRARFDQLNYVLTGQYLSDETPDLKFEEIGLRPWLLKGIAVGKRRITQSIVHSELVILSGRDAQQTYGALTLFYLVCLGGALFALLCVWKVPWRLAAAGGLWAGLLPAVTQTHLDGFLSQTVTFWIVPAIAGVLAQKPLRGVHAALAGIFLGFFIGAYSEYSFLGAGTLVFCLLLSTQRRQWLPLLGVAVGLAVLCNIGYLFKFVSYFSGQLAAAAQPWYAGKFAIEHNAVANWARDFIGEFSWPRTLILAAGLVSLLLIAMVSVSSNWANRKRYFSLLATPAAAAGVLLLWPRVTPYALVKLLVSISPAAVAIIVAGAATARLRTIRWAGILAVGAGLFISVLWLYQAQKSIIENGDSDILSADLPELRSQLSVIDSNRNDDPVVIDAENPLAAGWLTYYLRDKAVYLARQTAGDNWLPSEWWGFRQIPSGLHRVIVVKPDAITARESIEPYPALTSPDAKEQWAGGMRAWAAPGHCIVNITRDKSATGALFEWFCFQAQSTSPGRELILVIDDGRQETNQPAGVRQAVLIKMSGGKTTLHFRNTKGDEPFVLIPFGLEPLLGVPTKPPPFFHAAILEPPGEAVN